jgi:hypothetical protein
MLSAENGHPDTAWVDNSKCFNKASTTRWPHRDGKRSPYAGRRYRRIRVDFRLLTLDFRLVLEREDNHNHHGNHQ